MNNILLFDNILYKNKFEFLLYNHDNCLFQHNYQIFNGIINDKNIISVSFTLNNFKSEKTFDCILSDYVWMIPNCDGIPIQYNNDLINIKITITLNQNNKLRYIFGKFSQNNNENRPYYKFNDIELICGLWNF